MFVRTLQKEEFGMLRVFATADELQEAEALTNGSVYLLPIHYSIRHERLGIFPEAECSIFGFPDHSPQFWMVIRRNKFTRPHVFMASRSQLFVSFTDIDSFLILALPYLLELDEFYGRILGQCLSSRMIDLLGSYFDFTAPSYLSNYFIVDQNKQRQLLSLDIKLADGYVFAELDPEVDADAVASAWKFSTDGDRKQFAAKIRRLPSIGVKSEEGALASFTVLDASGFFNNQYTFEEHRKKGLADRSELKLCQKVISCGVYPLKFVELDNTAVLARSTRSQWWTKVTDETGRAVLNDHRLVFRRTV